MKQAQQKVREFMRMAEQELPQSPTMPGRRIEQLRFDLIEEELNELYTASGTVQVADALGDLLYVVLGAANAYGIELEPVFNEIHRSNMSKLWSHNEVQAARIGEDMAWMTRSFDNSCDIKQVSVPALYSDKVYIVKSKEGKLLKSPSYSPANLTPILTPEKPQV